MGFNSVFKGLKNSAFYTQCNYDYRMFVITSSDYFPQA